MSLHKWRVGDQAMLAGEPVTIAGFIDHGEPRPPRRVDQRLSKANR